MVLCVPRSHKCMLAAIPRCMWQDGGGAGAGVDSSAWALPRLSLLLHPEGGSGEA